MSLFTEISEDMAKEEMEKVEAVSQIEGSAEAVPAFDAARNYYLEALRVRALELQNDGNFDLNEADVRFSTALNLSRVRNSLVAIIGAGGLGNWQWRILASMGFKRIAIYDDDNVGIENVGPQAHSVFDLDMPKVQAVENAALMYRGIKILGRNRRVMSYSEICEDLGENPDIVIGCTDSADFRNNFIGRLINTISSYGADNQLPDLFIDYRMSLGDWVAYIIPAKAMKSYSYKQDFCAWYQRVALFSELEAVREPCTERAIAYTGANVASFTGALMHWFYSGGRQKFHDPEYMRSFANGDTVMPGRKVSFSSRDFEFITDTSKEKKLEKKLAKMREEAGAAWDFLRKGYGIPADFSYFDSGDAIPEDYLEKYRGKLLVALKDKKVLLCGFNNPYSLRTDSNDDLIFSFTRESWLSTLQPYAVYECVSSDRRELGTLRLLDSEPGDVFQIGSSDNYARVQKDYVEQICNWSDDPYDYARVDWEDIRQNICFEPVSEEFSARIASVFDRFSREFDQPSVPCATGNVREIGEEGAIENASHEAAARGQKLGRSELVIGMMVTIGGDNEPLTIVDISGNHFTVHGHHTGEDTNYSLRRFPDMYRVSDN